jgi:hypothetical protein
MSEEKRVEYHEDPVDGSVHEVSTTVKTPETPSAVVKHTETLSSGPAVAWMEQRRYALERVTQIIWLVVGFIEVLLSLRFVLKLIGANPEAGFAQLIYGLSAPFMVLFYNLTGNPAAAGSVIEVTTLIAMLVYALLGWLLVKLVWVLFYKPPRTTVW